MASIFLCLINLHLMLINLFFNACKFMLICSIYFVVKQNKFNSCLSEAEKTMFAVRHHTLRKSDHAFLRQNSPREIIILFVQALKCPISSSYVFQQINN